MRIFLILIIGMILSNCSNSYVKNKKKIVSPDDLMKFTNIWCEKQRNFPIQSKSPFSVRSYSRGLDARFGDRASHSGIQIRLLSA